MIADKRKIDGAVVSGPLITTIVDIVVLIIYFGMVSAIFIPLFTSGILPDSSSMSEVTSRLLSMA
ncbi:MAG: hypothetical protein DRP42_02485 [Tenericutes bacterium]|nr:MAG: hypothetical protein DRP42_02485 [Mycoplasmatota bacterium]